MVVGRLGIKSNYNSPLQNNVKSKASLKPLLRLVLAIE